MYHECLVLSGVHGADSNVGATGTKRRPQGPACLALLSQATATLPPHIFRPAGHGPFTVHQYGHSFGPWPMILSTDEAKLHQHVCLKSTVWLLQPNPPRLQTRLCDVHFLGMYSAAPRPQSQLLPLRDGGRSTALLLYCIVKTLAHRRR